MAWSDLVEDLHSAVLSEFGVSAIWTPQAAPETPVAIAGIVKNPALEEEFIPGGATGVSVVRFWIDMHSFSGAQPAIGDQIEIAGVNYDVAGVDVDIEGGATLKLRRNS